MGTLWQDLKFGLRMLAKNPGVTAVLHRTSEIDVRTALGAQRMQVLGLILRQGLVLAIAGVAVGIALAFALTRFLASVLFGVQPFDPLTFVCVALLLLLIALAACYLPAAAPPALTQSPPSTTNRS